MISPRREKQLQDLEKRIGVTFLSKSLLDKALTHSSYAYESRGKVQDNERLEFLGDAVLKLVMSEYLFERFPERQEGELTKIRASVISDVTLAHVAKKMKLGEFVLLGSNEKRTGGVERKSNLANAFEALLGAIYMDSGIGVAREMTLKFLSEDVDRVSKEGFIIDFKSAVQEFVQKKGWGLPNYRVIRESGPRHHRTFITEVVIKGESKGTGRGPSKKESEQAAAKVALYRLKSPIGKRTEAARQIVSAVRKKMNFKRRRPE